VPQKFFENNFRRISEFSKYAAGALQVSSTASGKKGDAVIEASSGAAGPQLSPGAALILILKPVRRNIGYAINI